LRAAIIIGAMVIAGNLSGCIDKHIENVGKGGPMTERSIEEVLRDRTDEWMSIVGVEGVAIGEHKGKSCIRIFTSVNPKNLRDKIPSSVEGFPVIIEKTGRFRAPLSRKVNPHFLLTADAIPLVLRLVRHILNEFGNLRAKWRACRRIFYVFNYVFFCFFAAIFLCVLCGFEKSW